MQRKDYQKYDDVSPLLTVENIAVNIQVEDRNIQAVENVFFSVYEGETIAIVGESGSGKSISARTIMRLLPDKAKVSENAKVIFNGHDLLTYNSKEMQNIRGHRISMIFQEPMTSLNPLYTVGSQICEIILAHEKISKKQAIERTLTLLSEVKLPDPDQCFKKYPHQLSGGQRQRVMIAMAIANKPSLLIADEPTTALDVTVQAEILLLLKDLQEKYNMGMILITHDLNVVRKFSDYVYVMRYGKIREHNITQALFDTPQDDYTKELLESEPKDIATPLPQDRDVILNASDICVTFKIKKGGFFSRKLEDFKAVDHLGLTLHQGETLGIVGESGSGKTTFGHALIRLIKSQGNIYFKNNRIDKLKQKEMRPFRKYMQIVLQDPFSSLNPRLNIRQTIEEGLIVNRLCAPSEREERVKKALCDSGMPDDILLRYPHEFSGGQRQRIAIAKALVLEPELILLDEPTSALDLSIQAKIIDLLKHLQKEKGLSYLFISHDLKVIRSLCHNVIVMRQGKIVEAGKVTDVLANPQTTYTKGLVKSAFEISIA